MAHGHITFTDRSLEMLRLWADGKDTSCVGVSCNTCPFSIRIKDGRGIVTFKLCFYEERTVNLFGFGEIRSDEHRAFLQAQAIALLEYYHNNF